MVKALIDAGVTYDSVEQVAAGYCFGKTFHRLIPPRSLPRSRNEI